MAKSKLGVINYIQLLVVITSLAGLATVAAVLWHNAHQQKINDIEVNYHTASSQHITTLRYEVMGIKNYINNRESPKLNNLGRLEPISLQHLPTKSLHIVNQRANKLFAIHKKYQNSEFTFQTEQLQAYLQPLLSLLSSIPSKQSTSTATLTRQQVDAILLTLTQLDRLHINAKDILQEKAKSHERKDTQILLFFVLAVIAVSGFIINKLLTSTKLILASNNDTEDTLFREKELMRTTLSSIADAVITTDKDGLITTMNPTAERLTAWPEDTARGQPITQVFRIIDPSTREPYEIPIDKVITTGKVNPRENHTTLIAKDGNEYQITDSAAPIRNDNSQTIGLVLVFSDVTEQSRLREAATKSERNLQAIMDNSPSAIYVKDTQGRFIFANQHFKEASRQFTNEIIGRTSHQVFPKDAADEMRSTDVAVEKAGHAIESEEAVPLDDGLHIYSSIKFPLFDEDRNIYAVGGVSTDITARKYQEDLVRESAQRLAEAQRLVHIGNWERNLLTDKLTWSEEVFQIIGVDSQKFTASYKAFIDKTHPDDREMVEAAFRKSLENKTPYNIKHRLQMQDGTIKHVQQLSQIFYDESGRAIRASGTVQDISEFVKMEEALRHSQKMDALGKLTGGVAHDFNNLLGIVRGYTEVLELLVRDNVEKLNRDEGIPQTEEPTEKLNTYTQEIYRAVERGAKLTQKLLSFSQKKSLDTERCDINITLLGLQHMLEKTLTAKIELVYDLADDLWPVRINAADLEDAVVNMGLNAQHAMGGQGQLSLKSTNWIISELEALTLHTEPGEYVLFSLTDTGCGMSEAIREKIFDPFFTTKGEKGTGLGLSQVYGFIERSGGVIKVNSTPNQGTECLLFFPRDYGMKNVTDFHKGAA